MAEAQEKMFRVLGGQLKTFGSDIPDFEDPENLEFVGCYQDYDSAYDAWKAAAFGTIDDAHRRYIIQPV